MHHLSIFKCFCTDAAFMWFSISLQNVQALTPIKLVKLEFSLPEETFVEQCNGAEKNLQQEQRQLQKNENVKETLQKHRVS